VQDRKYENNQFYELTWPALNEGPFIVPNIHLYQYFNKNLPFDIIEIIISYLNFEEVFILALSKLFLPALFQIPTFFEILNNFFYTPYARILLRKKLYTHILRPLYMTTNFILLLPLTLLIKIFQHSLKLILYR